MELKARKKTQAPAPIASVKASPRQAPEKPEHYRYMITIQCNTMLYHTIQNMLTASHAAQDFTYTSIAQVIRAALAAYRNGMRLTELDEKGEKLTTTIRVDRTTKDFYSSLPDRMRVKILERALRSFLKERR